jgi:hypothetical protein
MRKPPSNGRYQIQANDITSKDNEAETARFTELMPNTNKLYTMEYLETEHNSSLTPHLEDLSKV